MSIFLFILILLVGVLISLAYAILLARIYYAHVRKKGYGSPLIFLVFPAVILVALAAGGVGLAISHREDFPGYLAIALYLVGPVALGTAGLYAGARFLPKKTRTAGARKIAFPYRLVGWSLLAGGIAQVLLFGFLLGWKTRAVMKSFQVLFQVCLPLSFGCFYLAKRAGARSAGEILEADTRPPVLYLRAFTSEEEMFVSLPGTEARKYTSYLGTYLRTTYGATLEQYFGGTLREFVGPFVALGNPLDYAPPEGAARMYERDENWKERFLNLARRAACIIIQVGESQNLRWEFEAIKAEGLQTKVFILTSPKKKLNAWNRFAQKSVDLAHRIKGTKRTEWPEFAEGMRGAGYQLDDSEPPPGSIMSFDQEGSALLLATEAESPSDYVGVMMRQLEGEPLVA
jgi:hypothetical protein